MKRLIALTLGLNALHLVAAPDVTWSVMHPTELDPAYMARVAAKAVEYGGVGSFEVCGTCHSGMGGMDGLLLAEPYPTARAKRNVGEVEKIRAALRGCIAEAHKVGKKLYYWHREGYLPDGILADLPGLRDADGEIDLLGETFASYLRWKVQAAFAAVPELDGFVLTLSVADVPRQSDRAFRRGDEGREREGVESASLLDALQGSAELPGDPEGDVDSSGGSAQLWRTRRRREARDAAARESGHGDLGLRARPFRGQPPGSSRAGLLAGVLSDLRRQHGVSVRLVRKDIRLRARMRGLRFLPPRL